MKIKAKDIIKGDRLEASGNIVTSVEKSWAIPSIIVLTVETSKGSKLVKYRASDLIRIADRSKTYDPFNGL